MGQQVAVDVGPVYVRVVILLPGEADPEVKELSLFSSAVQGTFYCLKYTPTTLSSFSSHALFQRLTKTPQPVAITGIGAKTVGTMIEQVFQVSVHYETNTPGLIKAISLMERNHQETFYSYPGSAFQISSIGPFQETHAQVIKGLTGSLYPCILVNLRSGISFYRLNSDTDYKRIQGSCLGGTTIWSLMKLLTKFETPEEAMVASLQGDNTPVDMSVGDIYGSDYQLIGLNRDIIASSCAKLRFAPEPAANDLAKSVFGMFILNLIQLSYLISMIEEVDKVMIVGNMISVPLLMESAQACMNYHSKGTRQMIFNEYSFYLGAIGELI